MSEGPTCPQHKCEMEPVPAGKLSREAAWCGTWYGCPRGCHNAALDRSPELQAQLEEQSRAHEARRNQKEFFAEAP